MGATGNPFSADDAFVKGVEFGFPQRMLFYATYRQPTKRNGRSTSLDYKMILTFNTEDFVALACEQGSSDYENLRDLTTGIVNRRLPDVSREKIGLAYMVNAGIGSARHDNQVPEEQIFSIGIDGAGKAVMYQTIDTALSAVTRFTYRTIEQAGQRAGKEYMVLHQSVWPTRDIQAFIRPCGGVHNGSSEKTDSIPGGYEITSTVQQNFVNRLYAAREALDTDPSPHARLALEVEANAFRRFADRLNAPKQAEEIIDIITNRTPADDRVRQEVIGTLVREIGFIPNGEFESAQRCLEERAKLLQR